MAGTAFWSRISADSAAEVDGRFTCVVRSRFRWMRKPLPTTSPPLPPFPPSDDKLEEATEDESMAMAVLLVVKMVALRRSDFPPPLQKHQESLNTLIVQISLKILDEDIGIREELLQIGKDSHTNPNPFSI